MNSPARLSVLGDWLKTQFPGESFTLEPASEDASFRRYFRVKFANRTVIAMDAPPEHEDCKPFIFVCKVFSKAGINVPQILAQDVSLGFLLLTDLHSCTYLNAFNKHDAKLLYLDAINALIKIQLISEPEVLPLYNEELLRREVDLFEKWYVNKHLKTILSSGQQNNLKSTIDIIIRNNLDQPRVFVHRDYHSRNLMLTEPNPGILDFQDAVYGPITYDLVSLFKDAYVSWEEEQILDWVIRYWQQAKQVGLPVNRDFVVFYRDFEFMGVQRQLKVLGIFSRLYYRDNKSAYLQHIPRVSGYLRKTCERYRELNPLLALLEQLEGKETLGQPV
jgi:N-acetylmuramate 1-kinase